MNTRIEGGTSPGFASLADAFADAFTGKDGMGAALCVRVGGETVADLWAGTADARDGSPWTKDTTSVIFSCTKGLTSILAARLVQDGLLGYEDPVVAHWPEFAAAGKERITVADLLAHRSGLSAPRDVLSVEDVVDWDRVTGLLAAQEPLWPRGAGHAYHALTHGWLAGEVVRRVTGGTVGQYFDELIATPLHADAWIGLPDSARDRVARLRVGASLTALVARQAAARPAGEVDWSDRAMTLGNAFPTELVDGERGFNDPRIRAAELPGAGGIASARALAAIWSSTVTETDGVRLLDAGTVADAIRPQTEGTPVFGGQPPFPRWGMGFQLPSLAREYLGPASFGHDGAGGQVAFADVTHQVGFAFLTNLMEAGDDHRATSIVDELRRILRGSGRGQVPVLPSGRVV
ncbi:beta-lactamase family protein [Streptomyces sp. NBC_01498]|uniref:serine hydrolase domain-containing protein n=1 Tax=Streptomyces sp. NBC_01498 TaxID=2975870 RepID=UPI002E7C3ACF|nr:serine hydrolase domain-containing protein [Streptomyces sp. NBC_01498]WTL28010.1 beta-lactamase family protein [Streptomyces sp. NBC_01498]